MRRLEIFFLEEGARWVGGVLTRTIETRMLTISTRSEPAVERLGSTVARRRDAVLRVAQISVTIVNGLLCPSNE